MPTLNWQMWEDPLGGRDTLVAWQSEHFRPLTAERMNPGFSSSVFWLRTQLRNTRAEPVTYWLVLDNPRLEDVQLSQRAMGDMGPGITRVAGWRYPQFWREVSADMVVFPITVPGGGMEELMLRVESRSAVSLGTSLWQPLAFREQETNQHQLQGLMMGMLGAVAVYALIQGVVRRDTVFTLFALWLASFMCHA
ncbi:7TMR-DISMED2 domain-containing protein, partial [Rivihabitans pingtungensis]